MNLAIALFRAARLFPDKISIRIGVDPWASWRQTATRVGSIAGALRETLRLAPGDRVALCMTNCPQYVELLYACWCAGLIAVPINAKLHERELAYIIEHSGAKALFVTPLTINLGSAALELSNLNELRMIDVQSAEYGRFVQHNGMRPVVIRGQEPAWLFYTSGTTGKPKGATLTHSNLQAMSACYFMGIDSFHLDGNMIHCAPMSHGSGLYMLPQVLMANTQVFLPSTSFDPLETLSIISKLQQASSFVPPTILTRLAGLDGPDVRSNLRSLIFGGAPMLLADLRRSIEKFGFHLAQLYGQGESPMTISSMRAEFIEHAFALDDNHALQSVGVPQSSVEVSVVDDRGTEVPVGEAGEICVRGPTVMAGYWRDEAATSAAIKDGWLCTGDIGSFDDQGLLSLLDRSKDLIISGGVNVYPREVEEVITSHPDVVECAVVGKADTDWGERVVAFVVLRPGAKADQLALDQLCLSNIARFKRPKEYQFLESLPRNAYGKVLKRDLRLLLQRPS